MLILSSLKLNVVISLGEYINAVVSRIVIGTLDLKQFLPKFHPGTDLWPLFAKTRDISDYFNITNY